MELLFPHQLSCHRGAADLSLQGAHWTPRQALLTMRLTFPTTGSSDQGSSAISSPSPQRSECPAPSWSSSSALLAHWALSRGPPGCVLPFAHHLAGLEQLSSDKEGMLVQQVRGAFLTPTGKEMKPLEFKWKVKGLYWLDSTTPCRVSGSGHVRSNEHIPKSNCFSQLTWHILKRCTQGAKEPHVLCELQFADLGFRFFFFANISFCGNYLSS